MLAVRYFLPTVVTMSVRFKVKPPCVVAVCIFPRKHYITQQRKSSSVCYVHDDRLALSQEYTSEKRQKKAPQKTAKHPKKPSCGRIFGEEGIGSFGLACSWCCAVRDWLGGFMLLLKNSIVLQKSFIRGSNSSSVGFLCRVEVRCSCIHRTTNRPCYVRVAFAVWQLSVIS